MTQNVMPNSALKILNRWREMDRELGSPVGLNVNEFAKRWKVSARTIHRDLAAFREMGQRMNVERGSDREYRWFSEGDWLFVANVPSRIRKAAEAVAKRLRST